ncbi:MAG: tetratricopeptide repeat protein [Lentisphaerae bacterium]|nr:tetratricopeptide repeat protein [Lentisphaerota bacterium]
MSRPAFLLLVLLLLAAMPAGHSLCAPPAILAANNLTNVSGRAGMRQEELLWSSAQESFRQLQYREARRKFAEFVRQYRNDVLFTDALFYQGLCDMRLNQENQAVNAWDQVLRFEITKKAKSRAWLLTMEQMTLFYDRKNREEDRKKALRQILAEFPADPIAVRLHVQAAEARMKASDYAGALAYYLAVESQLAAQDRKNMDLVEAMTGTGARSPRALLEAANENLGRNNVDQAIVIYQEILKQYAASPQAPEAKAMLGWCCYLKRDYDKAEKLYKEVIEAGPPTSHWVGKSRWFLIVLAVGPRGNDSRAIELCDVQARVFDGDRLAEQAMFTKAWLYWTQKEWAKGKKAFAELLARYPERGTHPPVRRYISDCEAGMSAKAGK